VRPMLPHPASAAREGSDASTKKARILGRRVETMNKPADGDGPGRLAPRLDCDRGISMGYNVSSLSSWTIAPLAEAHLRSMAEFASSDPATVEQRLGRAIRSNPGVAAVADGRLLGAMIGLAVEGLFGSGFAAYVPEWGLAVAAPSRARTFERLYGAIAESWASLGWGVHCFTIPADDTEIADELRWLGFGLYVVDAARDLVAEPPALASVPPGIRVERARPDDLDGLLPLAEAHEACYAASPTFRVRDTGETPAQLMTGWLTRPGFSVWIARSDERILSFIHLRPAATDVPLALRGDGTIGIGGAFTLPVARCSGLGSAVLASAMRWAAESGFRRMIVDFETANVRARSFWLRSFRPAYLSFVRHLDDRLVQRRVEA
jgi:GNAT superfamily N-acetyltransferase